MSLIKTRNPNPFPIGIKFGFLKYGGRYRTRTCDPPHVKRMLIPAELIVRVSLLILTHLQHFVNPFFSTALIFQSRRTGVRYLAEIYTVQSAFTPPHSAVIVVVPLPTPVTTPLSLTLATDSSLLDHVTVWSVPVG